jgi:16S rRNA (guanine527-N7)-methyltransferase
MELPYDKELTRYAQLVIEANETMDLTAERDVEAFILSHIADALSGIELLKEHIARVGGTQNSELRIADIGSGAGIPGIPLAIALPHQSFFLIEPSVKRAQFLEKVVHVLSLNNVRVINERAEILGRNDAYRETFHIITARAVSGLASLAELALPLCTVDGICFFYKNPRPGEIDAASYALHTLGSLPAENAQVLYGDPASQISRNFVILHKKNQTPNQYPRRNGLPQKRPLTDQ